MAVASTTAAVISAAVALAGTAAGAYGAIRQAESARQQQEYQAKLANRQAQIAEQNAQQQEEGLSLSAIINRIEANRNTFQTIKRTLETDLYENQSEYESKLNSYIEEGMKAPYSASPETTEG